MKEVPGVDLAGIQRKKRRSFLLLGLPIDINSIVAAVVALLGHASKLAQESRFANTSLPGNHHDLGLWGRVARIKEPIQQSLEVLQLTITAQEDFVRPTRIHRATSLLNRFQCEARVGVSDR